VEPVDFSGSGSGSTTLVLSIFHASAVLVSRLIETIRKSARKFVTGLQKPFINLFAAFQRVSNLYRYIILLLALDDWYR